MYQLMMVSALSYTVCVQDVSTGSHMCWGKFSACVYMKVSVYICVGALSVFIVKGVLHTFLKDVFFLILSMIFL